MDKDISRQSSNSSLVMSKQQQKQEGIKLENPFALKVGQVFTGFGIGCGIGIGAGRPINLSAIPMLNQVMGAASGATYAVSGVGRHVNNSLRKLGAKNIEAGIGCGIGFGYGFGVGVAVKPLVLHQIQSCLLQMMMTATKKLGMSADSSISQGVLPVSLQSGTSTIEKPLNQNPAGNAIQWRAEVPGNSNTPQGLPDASFGRTEKVISSFLQNPILRDETEQNELAGRLQTERNLIRMVLNHQQVIEELREENENLRQVLAEHLKVPPSKLHNKHSSKTNKSPCTDCFECRRKQRKR